MLMRTMAGSCRASGRSCPLGSANPTTHIIYQNASPYFAFHDRSRQTTSPSSRCNYSNLAPYCKRANQMQVDNVALFGALDATYVTSGQRLPVTYTHALARGHTHKRAVQRFLLLVQASIQAGIPRVGFVLERTIIARNMLTML